MAAFVDKLPHWRVGQVDLTATVKDTLAELSDDDVSGLAAAMTYHVILAIFPFLIFLVGVTAIIEPVFGVANLTQRIVDKASEVMPDDSASVVESFTAEVVSSPGGWAMAIGLVGALWAASSGVDTAMKALNRAYDVSEDRGFIKRKLVALTLTVIFAGLLLVAGLLIVSGPVMAGGIGAALGWKSQFVVAYNIATPVVALCLLALAAAFLYAYAPNTDHQFRWVSPGAVLFVIGWAAFSVGFTFYVSRFGSYNRTYGSLAAVIILLLWLYWSNVLLLAGGELNAVLARRHDPEYRRQQGDRPAATGSKANP